MDAASDWQGDASPPEPRSSLGARLRDDAASRRVLAAVWRADELGTAVSEATPSGFAALDAELPGHGWPTQALTELLLPQPGVVEWRLLGPCLRSLAGREIVLVAPPRPPHATGLVQVGLNDRHLVWLQAEAPAERLWTTEQLIKSGSCGAIVAWLPQARADQIRRLQVCAQACDGPVFLCRPAAAQYEASAAPLRLMVGVGTDWDIDVRILKRRGPVHEGAIALRAVPGLLSSVLTPRLAKPSRVQSRRREVPDAVGSAAPAVPRRHATVY